MRLLYLALGTALTILPITELEAHHFAGTPSLFLRAAELPPDIARHCIPGPHELGRTRKLPGVAATSAAPWFYSRSVDAYPHCRYDSQAEADRARRRGD